MLQYDHPVMLGALHLVCSERYLLELLEFEAVWLHGDWGGRGGRREEGRRVTELLLNRCFHGTLGFHKSCKVRG